MGFSKLQRRAKSPDIAEPTTDAKIQTRREIATAALRSVYRRNRRGSQDVSVPGAVHGREEEQGLWVSKGPASGKSNAAGMPVNAVHGSGVPFLEGSGPHLEVHIEKVEDELQLSGQEEVLNIMDTMGTLSPVSNNQLLLSGSSQLEEGLTLFVNPMMFCESTDEDTMKEGKVASTNPYEKNFGSALGQMEATQRAVPDDMRNRELKRVEQKMEQQVVLGGGPMEACHIGEVKPTKDSEELVLSSAPSRGKDRLCKVSIATKLLTQEDEKVIAEETEEQNRGSSGWSFESDQEEWNRCNGIGIGHFREDTMWGGGVRPACQSVKYLQEEHQMHYTKDTEDQPADASDVAVKEAQRRAFINSLKLKKKRLQSASAQDQTISWQDKLALDAAVERAFKNVKPITLVRKGSSRQLKQAFSSESWRRLPPIQDHFSTLTDSSWRYDTKSRSLWSGEATTVVSHSTWSTTEDWAPKTCTHTVLNTSTCAVQSRDTVWGGLCVGLLAWLALFI